MNQPFVAVHVGAGFHSDANSKELKALCRKACIEAMAALKDGVSSDQAVVRAISVLENSPQTNAAVGSNLSLSGSVECDASIMDDHGNFGAVGSVEGVVNPIQLAHMLLRESSQGCLPLGRVPPLVLVGDGACSWARQHQIATCPPNDLITDRARSVYLDHMTRLEGVTHGQLRTTCNGSVADKMGDGLVSRCLGDKQPRRDMTTGDRSKRKIQRICKEERERECTVGVPSRTQVNRMTPYQTTSISDPHQTTNNSDTYRATSTPDPHQTTLTPDPHQTTSTPDPHQTTSTSDPYHPPGRTALSCCRAPLDTVGAICLDMRGRAGAGVSSGGISLKSPGRVGQAAMFGCGCWADHEAGGNSLAVACSTSGTGEYIIKTSLAKECALEMAESSLQIALDRHFLKSKRLKTVDQKLAGVIVLNYTTDNVLHFSWGHTTESMCIGFMGGSDKAPTAIISKMENPERSGTVSHVQAVRIT